MKSASSPHRFAVALLLPLVALAAIDACGADPEAPAELTITTDVVAPDPQPFGLNELVGPKGFNNLERDGVAGSMEPRFMRAKFFVSATGSENGKDWFGADNLSSHASHQDGFWNGADVRVYRRAGSGAYERVHTDKVGSFQAGRDFWAVNFWPSYKSAKGPTISDCLIPADGAKNCEFTDGRLCQWYQQTDLRNGRAVYYVVRAISEDGVESDNSNVANATPLATIDNGPKISKPVLNPVEKTPDGQFKAYRDAIEATGGTPPLKWELLLGETLPDGLSAAAGEANGRVQFVISGTPASDQQAKFKVRVTDSANPPRSDEREMCINLPVLRKPDPRKVANLPKPLPPKNVTAVANNGSVTLKWEPTDSSDAIGYRVYRSYFPPDQHVERVMLAGNEGAIQKGDLVFLDLEKADTPADQLHDRILFTRFERDPFRTQTKKPGSKTWTDWRSLPSLDDIPEISITHVPHPQPIPADFTGAGKTCLQAKAATDWGIKLNITIHGPKKQEWYNVLLPNHTYRFEAWMRQEGIPGGRVVFEDSRVKEVPLGKFEVGSAWKKVTCDFSVPNWTEKDLGFLTVAFEGGGTLWLDKVIIFDATDSKNAGRPDVAPKEMLPMWKEELKKFFATAPNGPKGALRYWGGQANFGGGMSLDDLLAPVDARRRTGSEDTNLNLGGALALMKEVNAEPWLTISSSFSEEEWRNLIEYLAGSPDSEYGNRRVADRGGIQTPWTDEFKKIRIECDNETWNNMFSWTFPGDKEKGIDRAEQYGAYSEMLFRGAKSAPAWTAAKLDGKVEFMVGGWAIQPKPTGYGHLAAQNAPSASYAGTAPYLGGWEKGAYVGGKTFTDEGISQWLLYLPRRQQPETAAHAATAKALSEQGPTKYRMAVYEGGPGYDLPSPTNPSGVVAECYGKSLAAAVTTLDCYLFESLNNYGPQMFFGFRPGTRWSSHVMVPQEDDWTLHPQTTFLALAMRNKFASGQMVSVQAQSMPATDVAAYGNTFKAMSDVPLLGTYAFRDGDKYTVFLISRKLDTRDASGAVTDPAITPVTLHLPFRSASRITLHKLAGDPRKSNVPGLPTYAEKNFAIEDQELNPKLTGATFVVNVANGGTAAGGKEGIPPGSVFAFVFEGTK